MGVVVEYENQSGEPRWSPSGQSSVRIAPAFGRSGTATVPDETINLKFEKIPEAAAAVIAGPSTASPGPTPTVAIGAARQALSPDQRTTTAATSTPSTCIGIVSRSRRSVTKLHRDS